MMDNMKDKFAQFSGISIMLVSASMTLFTRLVDGYYELKNVLSIKVAPVSRTINKKGLKIK